MTPRGDQRAFGLQPLTPYFEHVLMMGIKWTLGLSHQRVSVKGRASEVRQATTCLAKLRTVWNIVPHRRERQESGVYKVGCGNAFALPPQYSHQGHERVGPSLADPPATWRPTRESAWTCVASYHVSAPYAPPVPRAGHPRPCHVASKPHRIRAVVSRTTSVRPLVPLATSAPASN